MNRLVALLKMARDSIVRAHKTRPLVWGAVDIVILAVLGLLFWPVPYDPIAWEPKPNPYGTGVYAANERLAQAQLIKVDGAGPEGIDIDKDGRIYTGLADGRIVRLVNGKQETVANTNGRPLGVQFDIAGNLIIADATKGLLRMTPEGAITLLTDTYQGKRMLFVDDLDIARDGKIWFSDASTRYDLHDNLLDLYEGRLTGRLLVYDPRTRTTQLVLNKLGFANGVALAADDSFVLVNETMRNRVTRYWLKGPRRGQREIFIDNLPGYPDNITRDDKGRFWIALVAPRVDALDALMSRPFWRKVQWRVARVLRQSPINLHSWALGVDANGQVIHNLEDPSGKVFLVTSVLAQDGRLYLGSLQNRAIGVMPSP